MSDSTISQKPRISFVVPAFNEEAYIGTCVESIIAECEKLHRSRPDIEATAVEIIVVNNASTDHTAQVASHYPDVLVVDELRKGLSAARQAGYAASTGMIIANVDADSILPDGWLTTVLDAFDRNPELVALSGPAIYHDMSVAANVFVRLYYYVGYISYLMNRFIFHSGSLLQGGNFVIRRSSLDAVGGFNTDFAFYGEDTEIARMLNPLGPVVFTFDLPMYTSGRRLQHEGLLQMGWKYPINYIWTILFKKPFTQDYIDIRSMQSGSAFRTNRVRLSRAMRTIAVISIIVIVLVAATIVRYLSAR